MKKLPTLFLLIAVFFVGLVGAWVSSHGAHDSTTAVVRESAYDRVMRTGILRCGYVLWTPLLIKDPNSGQLSGVFYDYTEALGDALKLKVEWTEELGWGDFPAALNSGRIDAMCGGANLNATRARVIDFVRPIVYQQIFAYVRADDKRFDNNLDLMNDPSVTIVAVDGTSVAAIVAHDYPRATHVQLPEMTSLADAFVTVATGKADVSVQNPAVAWSYMAHNPDKIRKVIAKMPLRVFGDGIALAGGEDRLRRMLDIATDELLGGGQIEKIFAKYEQGPDILIRAAPPYIEPTE